MAEQEIKEFVSELRNKAEIFRKSGFEATGIIKAFDKSADVIEELLSCRAKAIDEFLHNAETKICDRILQNQARLDFASGLSVANRILDEVAEQMKAGAEL